MKMRPYAHVLGMIFNRPQLMAPELMFEAISFARSHLGLVLADAPAPVLRAAKIAFDDDEDGDGAEDDDNDGDGSGIAMIGVYGPLVPRRGNVKICSRMTSYESLAAQLDAAVADPGVYRIVLDIDSPGGAATGAFELADKIRAVNAVKPVSAIVNFQAFSGGYLLASAAGEISVSQSSGVGSIGVIAQHFDVSKMDEAMGVKVTSVYRGAKKNDLSPHEPLNDSSLATLNEMVDRTYTDFTNYVAKNRGIPLAAVKGTEAGLYFGQDAVDAGLADRLETPQDAVNRIASEVATLRAAKLTPVPAFGVSANAQKLRVRAAAMNVKNSL